MLKWFVNSRQFAIMD